MYQLSYHFLEIRLRIFYLLISLIFTLITSYYYQFEIIYIIGRPFLDLDHKFILIDLTEAFYTIIRICGIISFLIILPFFIYHIWSFYIPSRYNFERTYINKFTLLFFLCLFGELLFLYFVVFPKICEFLLSFEGISSDYSFSVKNLQNENQFSVNQVNTEMEINSILKKEQTKTPVLMELTARLESYVKLSTRFYCIMLGVFQIPFFVIIFYFYNIIDSSILCQFRKIFIFSSLLFSAFISPPDIISQCILAILFFFFYEILIIIGVFHSILLDVVFLLSKKTTSNKIE